MDEQLELEPSSEPGPEDRFRRERKELVESLAASRLNTVQKRVAWVLNHFPDARNSDVALWIRYWKQFHSEIVQGESVLLRDLYKLARPGTLTRARATIQNDFRMFLAAPEVRAQRKKLSEEERERAAEQRAPYPNLTVYMDETGKTGDHVAVGAVWFTQGFDSLDTARAVEQFAKEAGVKAELHFKDLDDRTFPYYRRVVDLVLERSPTISFTSISVDRRGLKHVDAAIEALHFHLLVRGIEHHNESGRAPLPRALDIFKDSEEPGRDRLLLASLSEKLRQAGETRWEGGLRVERVAAYDSKDNPLIQLADLYTSSVGRVLNRDQATERPKDRFADYFLTRLNIPTGPQLEESVGDLAVHLAL